MKVPHELWMLSLALCVQCCSTICGVCCSGPWECLSVLQPFYPALAFMPFQTTLEGVGGRGLVGIWLISRLGAFTGWGQQSFACLLRIVARGRPRHGSFWVGRATGGRQGESLPGEMPAGQEPDGVFGARVALGDVSGAQMGVSPSSSSP